ncbi:serine/arginine repetitive matrix protein 1 isoform X2 [Cydia pomonella]|uniref:serine/arginine repetitive matrix protein 1 isoform X2 n=1 Tax=Cydia pomonella TaxID=82600 RepID=UPI002ADDB292|nr:serine/arginine repetitive matrix protein 1 isoform X2 [Cydia pomonella]
MDVVGSEIGQKMRSAIKAKLTELGCYVDDELPDYVMVMVANKRTRAQMEDDLQLFLGDNTELFVNWLHQVLKKLQEVTVTAPIKVAESEKIKDSSSSKEKKSKDKKDKDKSKKSESSKKSKKKDKEKLHKKKDKESKKVHKSKKKSKKHEMIRPNVPPLLMNMEKDSEPSITDVFAGQILKNHGITLETPKIDPNVDKKPSIPDVKRPILPIIDPATISSQPEPSQSSMESVTTISDQDVEEASPTPTPTAPAPRDEQIKEMNEIEAKIQGLKQKLAEQLDSMSDDEDFLTIRTEAEELMNDFAEDVYQEISQAAPLAPAPVPATPPPSRRSPSPAPPAPPKEVETLPQIELKLPKRPVRERLGMREEKLEKADSPERFTPEREPEPKKARSRLDEPSEKQRKQDDDDDDDDEHDTSSKRVSSKVSALERTPRVCASVVRVRPRPRGAAPGNSLLLRAVADAHRSLLNIPPKVEAEPAKVKRALVKPMRRCVDAQKIVIQVQADAHTEADKADIEKKSPLEKEDFLPALLTKKIVNTDYVSPRSKDPRTSSVRDDTLVIETLNIHNPTVDKQKDTQFIVTMDGYDPNVFLAKKLLTEGLLDDDDKSKKSTDADSKTKEKPDKDDEEKVVDKTETIKNKEVVKEHKKESHKDLPIDTKVAKHEKKDSKDDKEVTTSAVQKKRLSDTSEESDTQVIINPEAEKKTEETQEKLDVSPNARKRKKSPIVFDVEKKEKKEKARERTESAGSDNHVTVTTTTNTHKYDSVPSSSHVVPAASFKTIQPSALPTICKFYPNCVNPVCHFAHPKPCRYGKGCLNKAECNFYHPDSNKWRYPV